MRATRQRECSEERPTRPSYPTSCQPARLPATPADWTPCGCMRTGEQRWHKLPQAGVAAHPLAAKTIKSAHAVHEECTEWAWRNFPRGNCCWYVFVHVAAEVSISKQHSQDSSKKPWLERCRFFRFVLTSAIISISYFFIVEEVWVFGEYFYIACLYSSHSVKVSFHNRLKATRTRTLTLIWPSTFLRDANANTTRPDGYPNMKLFRQALTVTLPETVPREPNNISKSHDFLKKKIWLGLAYAAKCSLVFKCHVNLNFPAYLQLSLREPKNGGTWPGYHLISTRYHPISIRYRYVPIQYDINTLSSDIVCVVFRRPTLCTC